MNEEVSAPRPSRSGSEKRQRSKPLTVRFTSEERAQIDADASAAGMTAGTYIRWRLTEGRAPRAVRRPPVELEALRVLLGQLGKVGSNLNQIAHRLNDGQPLASIQLTAGLKDVRAMRDAVLKALGYEVEP